MGRSPKIEFDVGDITDPENNLVMNSIKVLP